MSSAQENNLSCSMLNFTKVGENTFSLVKIIRKNGLEIWSPGKAIRTKHPSTFQFSYTSSEMSDYDGNYLILDTDYDNYSILYRCKNFVFVKTENVWVFSRKISMNETELNPIVDKVIKKLSFERNDITSINNSEKNCNKTFSL
jgi:hypothetical protein